MGSIRFKLLQAPEILARDVDCIRVIEHTLEQGVAIKVSPNAAPGIVFQHRNGRPAIENITTPAGVISPSTLFLYGPGVEPSVMNYKAGSYTTTQVILKPHALQTLLGLNALALADGPVELNEFSSEDLNLQLMEAGNERERIAILTGFLVDKFKGARTRDRLVEESLRLIQANIAAVSVKSLSAGLHISERQFERRFGQSVGVAPGAYIRVKRFNEAVRLMKAGRFERLTDIAYALNFHDQSHFIHEVKAFSGITPKSIAQKVEGFHDQVGFSYI
jgi:AraC-like DNA-binding protein